MNKFHTRKLCENTKIHTQCTVGSFVKIEQLGALTMLC